MSSSTSQADGQANEFSSTLGNYDERKSSRNAFDPAADIAGNTINFGGPHGLRTGDAVVYNNPDGADVGGLTHGQEYYVIKVDDNQIRLAETPELADAGTPIALDGSSAEGTDELLFGTGVGGSSPDAQQEQGQAMQNAVLKINAADSAHSGKSQAALDSKANSGTTAYIGNGAVITVGDSVGVTAKEVIELDSFAGSAAVGAVGIGGSVAVVNIGSKVEAYIGSATITAGSGTTDNVTVSADLVTDVTGKAWGGQAGGGGLGGGEGGGLQEDQVPHP
jgi:hypothetical protein